VARPRASPWRALEQAQRRWIVLNAILIAALINAALSALIAWLITLDEEQVPLWAAPLVEGPSTVIDTVGTLFVLPFLTTLIITTVVRAEMRHERLRPLAEARSWTERLPATRARRGAVLGLICMAVLGPPVVAVLVALDFGDLSVGEFVLYKAIFGVALGVVVSPPIALLALGESATAVPVDTPAPTTG
jgi:hypothetical protein